MATIQGVYVALFGRPADPTGLAYFNSVTKSGADLSAIGDLASTQEYKDRFAGQSNTQIVSSIYQSLFNRAPESAGLTFFVDALNKGTLNIKNIAIAILDGAQGDDKTTATNKITAADNFTKAIDTPVEVGSYQGNNAAQLGRNFLAPVTKDPTTIPSTAATDTALLAIVNATPGSTGTTGVIINVTAANEQVGPTVANPSFKSTAGDDTVNIGSGVINNNSKIDAGAGVDGLVISGTGTTGTAGAGIAVGAAAAGAAQGGKPTLDGVEKITVTFTGGTGGAGSATAGDVQTGGKGGNFALDVGSAKGVSEIWNDSSKAGTAGGAAVTAGGAGGDSVAFSNIAVGTTLGIKGAVTTDTVFGFTGVSGTSDSATLKLSGATDAKAVTVDGIETLNVAVDGVSSLTGLGGTTLDKIVVTGNAALTLTSTATTLKAVDASALGAGITLNVSAAANGVSVTGTKFVDTITLNNTVGVTTDKDVLVYTAANKSTVSAIDTINNFTLANTEDKIDVKAFGLGGSAGVTTFTVAANAVAAENTTFSGNKIAVDDANKIVYIDANNDGVFNAANDLAIKLVGADLTTFTKDHVIFS